MSMVGPRPEAPYYDDSRLNRSVPHEFASERYDYGVARFDRRSHPPFLAVDRRNDSGYSGQLLYLAPWPRYQATARVVIGSKDAWKRYTAAGSWYYEIIAPGFKYNMTDIAAAMGLAQLRWVKQP